MSEIERDLAAEQEEPAPPTPDKEQVQKEFKPTPQVNPILADLPAHLKDPYNYDKIRKVILEELASGHSHGEIVEWAGCAGCQRRFQERGSVMKRLGFKNAAQYMAWNIVHRKIKETVPLPKYNSG